MNFWETYQGTIKSGNNGNVIDFSSAEDFAKNEAKAYWTISLVFVLIGLLPGIVASISHKINPTKHLDHTHGKMARSILITVVFVVVALMCNPIFSHDVFYDNGIPDVSVSADESDIWFEAKEIVKDHLKAPSTAEFCSMSDAKITRSGNTWTIKGYVDAENSFGAKLRNNFTVVITFTDKTHYTIDRCDIVAK